MIQRRKKNRILNALFILAMMNPASWIYAEELFLAPPQVIDHPNPKYAPSSRAFQGIPSLAITPQGRLWATWYAGKT
ncbi:MAG: sialidase family protein, partial [Candidatus Hinthialibacter sp.]